MKIIKLIFIMIFTLFFLCGCKHDENFGLVFFNSVPINQSNALNNQKTFREGSKVYYLFIAPKRMQNEFIRVQVFKMTDKAPWGSNEVIRTKDYRLMKNEGYYHTNYFTIYEKGRYVMQIFSHTDFARPIGINDFYIE